MDKSKTLIDIDEMIEKLKSPDVSDADIRIAIIAALCMSRKTEHTDVEIRDFKVN